MEDKITFKKLSTPLKCAIVGGMICFVSMLIGFIIQVLSIVLVILLDA